jgi:magnesium-protoporphyrin O-methyltransferase
MGTCGRGFHIEGCLAIMTGCCAAKCAAGEYFGEAIAARDLQRYRQKGPDRETRLLLDGLLASRPIGDSLLDVGGGIGVIGFELLSSGVRQATIVDASIASLGAARKEADRRGVIDRVHFVAGDFVPATELDVADVVTMHRVVCCDPAYEPLLRKAVSRCRVILALSYPRDRWFIRWWMAAQNLVRRIRRKRFVTFVHDPEAMHAIICSAGFALRSEARTMVWAITIYSRVDVSSP